MTADEAETNSAADDDELDAEVEAAVAGAKGPVDEEAAARAEEDSLPSYAQVVEGATLRGS